MESAGKLKIITARVTRICREFTDCRVSLYAGNAIFFLVLSVVPLSAFVLGMIQWLPVSRQSFLRVLYEILPIDAAEFADRLLTAADPVAVLSVSAVTTLWAVSRGTYSLMLGLNRAGNMTEQRSWLRIRLSCLADTFLLILSVVVACVLFLVAGPLLQTVQTQVLQFVLITLFLSFVDRVFPIHTIPFRNTLPGAVFTSIVWRVFSSVYGLYLRLFSGAQRLYGTLSAVAVTLLWLYFCVEILLLGAILNRIVSERPS